MTKRTEIMLAGAGFAVEEPHKMVDCGNIRLLSRNGIVLKLPFTIPKTLKMVKEYLSCRI